MGRPADTLTHTIPEAAAVLGLSRHTVERLIANGDLPVIRIARRVLVPKTALARWVDQNTGQTFLQQDAVTSPAITRARTA